MTDHRRIQANAGLVDGWFVEKMGRGVPNPFVASLEQVARHHREKSRLLAAARRLKLEMKMVPVELIVGPSEGHRSIDDAYRLEARFLRKHFRAQSTEVESHAGSRSQADRSQ